VLSVAIGDVNSSFETRLAIAVPKYRIPAQSNFVLRLDVSLPKSPLSTHATFSPLDRASNAAPAPVAPAP
mgnify:CR=1